MKTEQVKKVVQKRKQQEKKVNKGSKKNKN